MTTIDYNKDRLRRLAAKSYDYHQKMDDAKQREQDFIEKLNRGTVVHFPKQPIAKKPKPPAPAPVAATAKPKKKKKTLSPEQAQRRKRKKAKQAKMLDRKWANRRRFRGTRVGLLAKEAVDFHPA